jgi:multiple sugar transport system ATP-binding protein
MAKIELVNITKKYKKVTALKSINLEIKDKEFFVLFGPAGAGKTTILKTVAGIEFPSEGYVKIKDENVNLVEPAKRNVAMVFENYALYPHYTVYDNIAFPLRSKLYRQPEEVIKKRVHEVTKTLRIDQLLGRLPVQISNGQKQRVALGRSMVRNPAVFLMDEPLAHLDAKMRHIMRAELKEMQASLNTTTIYVTHDYMEAMSLGDRIAIINHGEIEQIGSGDDIYYRPANEFVAKLVGEPEINIFPAKIDYMDGRAYIKLFGIDMLHQLSPQMVDQLADYQADSVDFGIRSQDIDYYLKPTKENLVQGVIYSFEPIGNKAILIVDIYGTLIKTTAPNDLQVHINDQIFLDFKIANGLLFDPETKKLIASESRIQDKGRQ